MVEYYDITHFLLENRNPVDYYIYLSVGVPTGATIVLLSIGKSVQFISFQSWEVGIKYFAKSVNERC